MTTAAADKVLWFVGPEPPRVEYTTSSGGESVFLRRDAAGQIWLLLQRDMLGREQADPDEFTYGPFGLLVQAAMRARAAGIAPPRPLLVSPLTPAQRAVPATPSANSPSERTHCWQQGAGWTASGWWQQPTKRRGSWHSHLPGTRGSKTPRSTSSGARGFGRGKSGARPVGPAPIWPAWSASTEGRGPPATEPQRHGTTTTKSPVDPCVSAGRPGTHPVELRGFEPLAFSLRTRRATNCATAPVRHR